MNDPLIVTITEGGQRIDTIRLHLADVRALVKLAWEMSNHIAETDQSATGSICGVEFAHRTIARVAAKLPVESTRMTLAEPGSEGAKDLADYHGRKTYTGD